VTSQSQHAAIDVHIACFAFVALLLQDEAELFAAVACHDIVVSLVPAPFHPPVAKACIAHHKHMVCCCRTRCHFVFKATWRFVFLCPYSLSLTVSEVALCHRTQVTASYVSPALAALHDEAVAAGVVILNEAGLDPGMSVFTVPPCWQCHQVGVF
jgi:alpha-aminoadipic semialdehyde synthase